MSSEHLAVLGGSPSFADELHVGRPNIGDRTAFIARLEDMLDRRWLTNDGPFVHEFEERVAERLGVRHCVAMCNGTVALEIAIRALGMTGEVIVPSFTFVATAHALQWQQVTPVFCDVDPHTHTIDATRLGDLVTPRTSGIIAVHLWGRACDVDALQSVADDIDIPLIFDAAHAFGATYRGRPVGGFGAAEVFSFHATKFFNSLEGGAVTTNDDDLALRLRLMRNFGFAGVDRVVFPGTNGKMTEACAAAGLVNLECVNEFIEVNRTRFELYRHHLEQTPGLSVVDPGEFGASNYQYVVVEVDAEQATLTRDDLYDVLWAERVLARRYFFPGVHRMEPYRSYFPNAGLLLPETESLVRRVLVLPTGTGVTPDDVREVCAIVSAALAQASAVRSALILQGRSGQLPHDVPPMSERDVIET